MSVEADVVLIAGPTASGKTRLAIEIAQATDALILNADSMQVYRELQVLTARPSAQEIAQAPHRLFGHRTGNQPYSVAQWLEDVEPFLNQDKPLVIVGGTGLYFNSLLNGLSPIPEIDDDIRNRWRDTANVPAEELHQKLDPLAAAILEPGDRQRIVRALEVYESTGRSIVEWQRSKGKPVLDDELRVRKILIMPERAMLHERINRRFDLMVEEGALEEVRALTALGYPETATVMKAIGVPQFSAYLRGELAMDEAVERSKAATRQYAKRQSTWFRNSFDASWEQV